MWMLVGGLRGMSNHAGRGIYRESAPRLGPGSTEKTHSYHAFAVIYSSALLASEGEKRIRRHLRSTSSQLRHRSCAENGAEAPQKHVLVTNLSAQLRYCSSLGKVDIGRPN